MSAGLPARSLDRSFDEALRITRTRARNFHYGFFLLPGPRRRAICSIYALLGACDDAVDHALDLAAGRAALATWRERVDALYAGRVPDHPLLPAVADTIERFGIPKRELDEFLAGVEMDLDLHTYRSFDDLYRYCYRVASVPGFMAIRVFGYDDESAFEPAEALGIAFQLTNILRDVRVDARRGRLYLPIEDLVACGYPLDGFHRGAEGEALARLVTLESDRAIDHYRRAMTLLPHLTPSGRRCVRVMTKIYSTLLDRVRRSAGVLEERPLRLGFGRKLGAAVSALAGGSALAARIRA